MLDGFDMAFASALERAIRLVLNGDEQRQGLYQSIRAVQNWDNFNRVNGAIGAYEAVLGEMHKIARQMNEPEQRRAEMRPIN